MDEMVTKSWAYAGRREGSDGKLIDVYFDIVDGRVDEKAPLKFSSERSTPLVGGIYDIKATPDNGRAILNGKSFRGPYGDRDAVFRWRTMHDAAITAQRARKMLKEDYLKPLAPLREAYWTTDALGRRAIEVAVLGYLRMER